MRRLYLIMVISLVTLAASISILGFYIKTEKHPDRKDLDILPIDPRSISSGSAESNLVLPETSSNQPGSIDMSTRSVSYTATPDNLALPIDPDEVVLSILDRGFVSPFGVVRKSLDRSEYGHSGIDLPSPTGSPIFAVDDGVIIGNELANDGRPGFNVKLLISEGTRDGEGWIFIYEHIELEPGITIGSEVQKGQAIARNLLVRSNNHLQLSYFFNDFKFSRNHTCWVDQLDPASKDNLLATFDNIIRVHDNFLMGWRTATDEGKFALRALLDEGRFPGGAKLCYPQGTDVRV